MVTIGKTYRTYPKRRSKDSDKKPEEWPCYSLVEETPLAANKIKDTLQGIHLTFKWHHGNAPISLGPTLSKFYSSS